MKVPNKVLNAIVKLVNPLPESEDKTLILQWAADGILKRSLLAASVGQKAAAEVE